MNSRSDTRLFIKSSVYEADIADIGCYSNDVILRQVSQ